MRGIIIQDEHHGERLTGIIGLSLSDCWTLLHGDEITGPLTDYAITRRFVQVIIKCVIGANAGARAALLAEYFHHRSQSQPSHQDGTLGIIRNGWCQSLDAAASHKVSVLATVGLDGDDLADECLRVGNGAISALGLSNWIVDEGAAQEGVAADDRHIRA